MNLRNIKDILIKMDFLIRIGNLDIDAAEVKDISIEEAERELKKMYVSLRVWLSRLSTATEMDLPHAAAADEDTEDYPGNGYAQLPLFGSDDY